MTDQAYPSVDGIASSWSDINVSITPLSGTTLTGADISGIKASGKTEVGVQKKGGKVVARTTGETSYEASASFYRSGYRKLVDVMVAAAPAYAVNGNQVRLSLITFDVDIQHTPPGETRIYHRRLKGCRLLGFSDDMKEGTEADKLDITLNPVLVVDIVDGKEIVLL